MNKFILASAFTIFIVGSVLFFTSRPVLDDVSVLSETDGASMEISIVPSVQWPVPGSAPETNVKYSIPLSEIKQGCARQDCIPSVDSPIFVTPGALEGVLDPQSIGIALTYKNQNRFYPFPMLETHELVNDTIAGDPILISYCPLCGTGIVFERTIDGVEIEFGVSGMLWQSNLLMYNRADNLSDRNLWSQILGTAVVGARAGSKLTMVPSDIMRFSQWKDLYPDGMVLNTGDPKDPYGGDYYGIAKRFGPNFNEDESVLPPTEYVYGIEINGVYKAYQRSKLPSGVTTDEVNNVTLILTNQNETLTISDDLGNIIPDIEGFWFSWIATHPDTLLWDAE